MRQLLLILCLLTGEGCKDIAKNNPDFAIFLVQAPSTELGKIVLEDAPLLTDADIVSYNWNDHSIALSDEGFSKLPARVDVSVSGKPFVVVASGQRCYTGAFWMIDSSISYPNPIIELSSIKNKIVRIQRAYPSAEFAEGDDPRSDKRILKVLTELKKLK